MNRVLDYVISSEDQGFTIMNYLRKQGFSRHILHTMKGDSGNIQWNGARGFGNTVLKEGDQLHIRVPETEICTALSRELPFEVLFEDQDLLGISKPPFMPVHPSMGNYENTLSNGIAFYAQQKGESYPIRCINRLDRDTTGVLLIAKNPLSGAILSTGIRHREIHRTYLAIVEGKIPLSGTIREPIGRVDGSVILRQVDSLHGEEAVTHYERLDYCEGYSLVKVWLETGRTHQIRVHMKYIGHPLPGDYLYNPVYDRIKRQPLHSWRLQFHHPITGEEMVLTAPIPSDMELAYPGLCKKEELSKIETDALV